MTRNAGMYPLALALASALLFALATPASKVLLADTAPMVLAGLLYLGAAIGVSPMALREDRRFLRVTARGRDRVRLAGAIVCGGILAPIAYVVGLKLGSASAVSLWLNLELVATAVLGHLIFRDHLGRFGWVGVAGVVGASVLLSVGDGTHVMAGLLVAVACLFWGLDNHLTALIDGITPANSTFWKGLVAGVFNIGLGLAMGGTWPVTAVWAPALLVGALSYGASIALYIASAQQLGATRAQIIFASSPFLAAALSAVFLHEPFGALHALSIAILAASVILLVRDRQSHEHPHAHEAVAHDHSHRHDDGHHTHVHEDWPASKRHRHAHTHEAVTHAHPHWPDLHHRHDH